MDKKEKELIEKKKKSEDLLKKVEERNKLKQNKKNLEEELKKFPDLNLEKINKWRGYLESLETYESLPEFDLERESSEKIKESIMSLKKFKEDYVKNIQICKKIGIEYDEKIINSKVEELEDKLSGIEKYERYFEIKQKCR